MLSFNKGGAETAKMFVLTCHHWRTAKIYLATAESDRHRSIYQSNRKRRPQMQRISTTNNHVRLSASLQDMARGSNG